MGVTGSDVRVLLDGPACGKVSVGEQTVTLNTGKGKLFVYHGHAEAEKDGTVVFVKDAEFHHKENGTKADSLGDRTCLCA